ncbi:MAG: hypothetical protein JWN51_105 [Phycisphaerales bacterium]|nr:hypothetical protein [Phycisphaerales bacterium]
MPTGLHALSIASLAIAAACAAYVAFDVACCHPQSMPIMNVVWPLTMLYSGPLGLWAYWKIGRASSSSHGEHRPQQDMDPADRPFWQRVFLSSTHCAAGCVCGDVIGEWLVFFSGLTIAGSMLLTMYVVDFVAAYVVGIAFQYFPIRQMRRLPPGRALWEAIKADTLALTAFQVGMYSWMALDHHVLFRGNPLFRPDTAVYWFMMQIAMCIGFLTTFPANWLLVRTGVKEGM